MTAKLNLADGHMRIDLFAEHVHTIEIFKEQTQRLSKAVESNGIALDALTVAKYD